MGKVHGYRGKSALVEVSPDTPGIVTLFVVGRRGGVQARMDLSATAAFQLATELNFAGATGEDLPGVQRGDDA